MFYSFGKGVLLIVEVLKIDGLGDLSVGLSGASLGSAHCFLSQANSQELEVHHSQLLVLCSARPSLPSLSSSVNKMVPRLLNTALWWWVLHTSATLFLMSSAIWAIVTLNALGLHHPCLSHCLLILLIPCLLITLFSAECKFFWAHLS